MGMEIKTVSANGLRFAYLEEGKGPLVLMLHGFPDTPHTWNDIRPKIAAKRYRVVTPWLRGYRPTEIPGRDTDLMTLAQDTLALIEALGESRAIVVGHDWGAAAAYGAATLDPKKVTKLFTVAIPHPATIKPTPARLWPARHFIAYKIPGAHSRFAANDFAALRELYKRWSPEWHVPDAEFGPIRECFADQASLHAAFGYYRALSLLPAPHFQKKIEVPTVVFTGTTDPQVSRANFEAAGGMFTSSYDIEELMGGHFLHRENPDRFAAQLLPYL